MNRFFVLVLFLVLGCGGSDPDCFDVCKDAGDSDKFDACLSQCESTSEAALPLSVAAIRAHTISSLNAPATGTACNDPNSNPWCECGTNYTDLGAPRCNTPTEPLLMYFPAIGCEVSSATLSYQVSTWSGATTVDVRRILRPVAAPLQNAAGYCASGSEVSWYRAGSQAWGLPGAAENETDRTAVGATKALASAGVRTETIDVSAVVADGCVSGCVLAQYESGIHTNVLTGTVSLTYECAGPPPVCGNGAKEGAEGCDDGNAADGDGCSAACAAENGYTCSGSPSSCATTCGDGIKAGAEECDNGAANGPLAPCSAVCEQQTCVCQ